jgi:hypothetical protein
MLFTVIEGDVTIRSGGVELAVEDATALPASTRGFIGVGYDGTNTRFIRVDASGYQVFVGAGVAGTPAGGVVSVQGVSGGQPVPVSQNGPPWKVEGTDADGAPPTENPVLAAGWDGTNVETLKTNSAGRLQQVLFDDAGNEHIGQKVVDDSIPVTMASDQEPIAITFTAPQARTGVSHATLTVGSPTAGTLIPVRATTYTEPSSEAQRSFASDDSNDTAAGTGARTVEFTYFDNTGDGPFTGEVTLAGTTPVDTTETDIRFIEKIRVKTVGSTGANEGTISIYSATAGGGTVIGSIGVGSVLAGIGDSETLWAHHYVPTGWTVQLAVLTVALQSGGTGTTGLYLIKSCYPLVADSAEFIEGGYLLLPGSFQRSYQFTGTVEGFARLLCYAIPGVNNTTMNAAFDWSEVPSP